MTKKPECAEAERLRREYENEKNPVWKKKARERYEAHKKNCAECAK